MSVDQRQAFLDSRKQGIGGSDIGSLLSGRIPVEYGCERSLWARLSGIPTDNPEVETEPMALGNLLEPVIALAYADVTGREVLQAPLKKHATESSLQVHVDRIIVPAPGDARTTDGVLEIKAVGREMMRKIQDDGLPIDYVLQLNHGMLCHGLTWGGFAIGTREDLLPIVALSLNALLKGEPPPVTRRPRLEHFELERNDEFCRAIEEHGPVFWKTLNDEAQAPKRLEPEDPRCGRCPRRIWCQGAAIMEGIEPESHITQRPDLAPLADEHYANVALLDQCEVLVAGTKAKIQEAMGPLQSCQIPITRQGTTEWKTISNRVRRGAERVDGRAMVIPYNLLRTEAIKLGIPGAALTPTAAEFNRVSMPSRPLMMPSLKAKKARSKGEVPETDE